MRAPAMTTAARIAWPPQFDATGARDLIIARDTPPGAPRPRCFVCGDPVTGAVIHVHHLLYLGRGGDGRPSNGGVVHGEEQASGCHITAIHRPPNSGFRCRVCSWQTAKWRGRCGQCQAWGTVEGDSPLAAAQGWTRSRHARRPRVYRTPLLCAVRGWIVLDDAGGWHEASEAEMAGDYT